LDEVVVVSMIAPAYVRSIIAAYSPRRAAAVASGAMKESLLRCFHIAVFAAPNLQGRLLDSASKRKTPAPKAVAT